jgi:hypothetical protein
MVTFRVRNVLLIDRILFLVYLLVYYTNYLTVFKLSICEEYKFTDNNHYAASRSICGVSVGLKFEYLDYNN